MEELKSAILGVLQGLTEFLPVSSSGHIELGKEVMNVNYEDNILFSVIVHAATALSTIVVFRKDITNLFKGLFEFKWNTPTKYLFMIAVSMIPVTLVGLLWKDEIESFFGSNTLLVGSMLLVTGSLLCFTNFSKEKLIEHFN